MGHYLLTMRSRLLNRPGIARRRRLTISFSRKNPRTGHSSILPPKISANILVKDFPDWRSITARYLGGTIRAIDFSAQTVGKILRVRLARCWPRSNGGSNGAHDRHTITACRAPDNALLINERAAAIAVARHLAQNVVDAGRRKRDSLRSHRPPQAVLNFGVA